LLRQGVTTVCDRLPEGTLDDDATLASSLRALKDAADETGIRLVLLKPITQPQQADPDTWLAQTQALLSPTVMVLPILTQWRREAPQLATLKAVQHLVSTLGMPAYYLHLSPTAAWREDVVNRLGEAPVDWLHKQGALHPKGVSLFGAWLTDDELSLLAEHQPAMVVTPSSSMGTGQPCPRVVDALQTGLTVAVGTGHWASSSRGMMLDEIRLTALAQQSVAGSSTPLQPEPLLNLVTGAAGQALNLPLGQLKPGHRADFMVLDLHDWSLQPHNQLLHHLAFALSSSAISAVVVDGKRVADTGDCLHVNEGQIMRQARHLAERLKALDADALAGWA
jgi:5-methylthioadenosine/S-adenosylhomocysteine deaminase